MPRLHFIDRLRGLATLVMIEVHVVNALLRPELRRGAAFSALNVVNGLVAPSFLFCAGFALALTLRRAWAGNHWTALLRGGLWRGAWLLALGYALHAPSLFWDGPAHPRAWRELRQADILQVIALSLTWLVLLAWTLRRPAAFAAAALLSGAAVVLAAPWVQALAPAAWPAWVLPYLSERVPTHFPLFPWAGFALLGAVVAATDPPAGWLRRMLLATLLAGGAAAALALLSPHLYPSHDPWRAGPAYVALRLGLVCGLGALLAWREPGRWLAHLDPLLLPFSRHSLLVYVVHVPLVYGGYGFSLRSAYGAALGPGGCLFWFCAVAAAMYLLARLMDWRARLRAPASPR